LCPRGPRNVLPRRNKRKRYLRRKDVEMSLSRFSAAGLVALSLALSPAAAQAGAYGGLAGKRISAGSSGDATKVRWRGHRHWRHHHRHHYGRDLAIGLGLGVLGAIASQPRYYYSDDARARCAARFRSFEWDTGLYTTYGGDKRVCPYLR
jgi:hypothetical protein